MNKSPIHTKITANLSKLKYKDIQNETQEYMAKMIFGLHNTFKCDLWILGISNLKSIFAKFTENIENLYKSQVLKEKIFLYYHFSQGQFKKAYNLKEKQTGEKDILKILENIGTENREKYFGF